MMPRFEHTTVFHDLREPRRFEFLRGSCDPIGFVAGDENLYRFVGNEPTGKVDPSGLEEATMDDIVTVSELDVTHAKDGYGALYHHFQSVELDFSQACAGPEKVKHQKLKAIADKIYEDMKTFKHFDKGNPIATALTPFEVDCKFYTGFHNVDPDTQRAVSKFAGDGPMNRMYVQLTYNDKELEITANTLGKHVLMGKRTWNVYLKGDVITIYTEAYDRRLSPAVTVGFEWQGAGDTEKVWKHYLNNIADAYKGPGVKANLGKTISKYLVEKDRSFNGIPR